MKKPALDPQVAVAVHHVDLILSRLLRGRRIPREDVLWLCSNLKNLLLARDPGAV